MIIGITGTIGAGKGTVANYLVKKGFRHLSVSGFLVQEAARRGMAKTRVVRKKLGNEYRLQSPVALVEAVLSEVNPLKESIVVESLHTVAEVEYVQHLGGKVISLDAPLQLRYKRICKRGGEIDAVSFGEFKTEQDAQMASKNPKENNIAAATAAADVHVENTGAEEELFQKVDAIVITL